MLLPARVRCFFDECLAEKRKVSPYNAIWWWQQQTLRKLMKNMTRKSWIFWNWQSLPELSDLEKSDLKIRSRSVKKRSTIRSRSWSRKMVKSDLRSDQKVICRSRSWSVDQDRHYFEHRLICLDKLILVTYTYSWCWNLLISYQVIQLAWTTSDVLSHLGWARAWTYIPTCPKQNFHCKYINTHLTGCPKQILHFLNPPKPEISKKGRFEAQKLEATKSLAQLSCWY